MEVAGRVLRLGSVTADTYVVGAEEDHIAPWRSSYAGATRLGGPVRFVLTSSGHGTAGADEWLEGCIVSGPQNVPVERQDLEDGISVNASHDGYARAFGLVHQRTWKLSADGARIDGADRLHAAPGRRPKAGETDFAIRFHLHSTVKAGTIENGQGALLVTPSGQQWIFHAGGFPLAIEESAFFASPEGTRATSQIVLSGKAKAGDGIDWVLMRKG